MWPKLWPKVSRHRLIVVYRKHGSYIRKARASYQLQRGVPKDIQPYIGKTQWKEPGGRTLREAQARIPAFLARTDQAIKIARGEVQLSPSEHIDRIPAEWDLNDPEAVASLIEGVNVMFFDGMISSDEADRAEHIIHRIKRPREHISAEELLAIAAKLKGPAIRTREGWTKALNRFLAFAQVGSPTAATRDQAVKFRSHLLETLAPSTVAVTIAYLAGLWSVLVELEPSRDHIFKGLTKSIKTRRPSRSLLEEVDPITPHHEWQGNPDHIIIFRILLLTGCRLAEACGLLGEDIKSDRILIRPNEVRPLKSEASERAIPLHPELQPHLMPFVGKQGLLWPQLRNDSRWGVNLAKPCRKIAGTNPHGLRHRAATRLRETGFNEAVLGRLLGHTANTVTGGYGSVPWEKLVEAVQTLN